MLFIAEQERGKGFGKKLLTYGIERCSVNDLAVNEQNPLAKGFYEYMGFKVYKRTGNRRTRQSLSDFIYAADEIIFGF